MLVEIVYCDVEGFGLGVVGFVGAVGLVVDEHVAVRGMIEALPLHVFADFFHPFVGQLEDALLVISLAAEDENGRVDAANALHAFGFADVFAGNLNVVVLNFVAFARRIGPGVDGEEFMVRGLDADAGAEGEFAGSFHDHLAAVTDAHGADAIFVDVRQALQIAEDGDQIFMIERGARLQHAALAADAVREILRRLGLLVGVRDFVAIVYGGDHVAAREHAVLHLRKAFGELLDLVHALATFAGTHGDGREGAVALGLANDDRHVEFVAGQHKRVIGRNGGALDGFAGDDVAVRGDGFRGRLAGAELGASYDRDVEQGRQRGEQNHKAEYEKSEAEFHRSLLSLSKSIVDIAETASITGALEASSGLLYSESANSRVRGMWSNQ